MWFFFQLYTEEFCGSMDSLLLCYSFNAGFFADEHGHERPQQKWRMYVVNFFTLSTDPKLLECLFLLLCSNRLRNKIIARRVSLSSHLPFSSLYLSSFLPLSFFLSFSFLFYSLSLSLARSHICSLFGSSCCAHTFPLSFCVAPYFLLFRPSLSLTQPMYLQALTSYMSPLQWQILDFEWPGILLLNSMSFWSYWISLKLFLTKRP